MGEGSARRIDLYLATHNIHKRHISMPLGGFEPAIPARERQQTHALNREAFKCHLENSTIAVSRNDVLR